MDDMKCEAVTCQHIIHHHRDRWKEYKVEQFQNDNKLQLINELCSRAHCYIAHGYQLYRLSPDELKQIEDNQRTGLFYMLNSVRCTSLDRNI